MYRINHGSVIVVTILQQIVRYLWYAPWVFLDSWMNAFRIDPQALTEISLLPFITAILASLAYCYLFAWLINRLMITRLFPGLGLAVLLWLPLGGLWMTSQYLVADIPWSGIMVDILGTLANAVLAGVILTLWRKRVAPAKSAAAETANLIT